MNPPQTTPFPSASSFRPLCDRPVGCNPDSAARSSAEHAHASPPASRCEAPAPRLAGLFPEGSPETATPSFLRWFAFLVGGYSALLFAVMSWLPEPVPTLAPTAGTITDHSTCPPETSAGA